MPLDLRVVRSFIQSVYRALMKGVADDEAERHLQLIRDALSPVLLCSAAGTNDVVQLDSMVKGGSDVNQPDYDHRHVVWTGIPVMVWLPCRVFVC
jgi:hypothetical protein